MKKNNALMRKAAEEAIAEVFKSQAELENFLGRTMERVDSMLINAQEFKLHPLVVAHLIAIKDLAQQQQTEGEG